MNKPDQKLLFESGNELAAYAAKQINYHVMGYYPITPSTQIAEFLDQMGADGEHDIALIPAEGEHSAAGICYGASTGGGRVFNATSANGLLYALEQLPVQSGTRMPMVLNIACRTVSGPLSIKGDHSDIMYTLNTGWIILFADSPAVHCCYFPLYEIEQGITSLTLNPEEKNKKIPVSDWLKMMGRTKHLCQEKHEKVLADIQQEVDRRWNRLKAQAEHPEL